MYKKIWSENKNKKEFCEVYGNGLYGYDYKNNTSLNAGNSGTAARLFVSSTINSPIYKDNRDSSYKKEYEE